MRFRILLLPLVALLMITSALALSIPTDVYPEDGALYVKGEDTTISSTVPEGAERMFIRWLGENPTGNIQDEMLIIGDKATVTFQDLPTGIYTFQVGAQEGQMLMYSSEHTITIKNIFDNAANMMQNYLDDEEDKSQETAAEQSQQDMMLNVVLVLFVVGYFWTKR